MSVSEHPEGSKGEVLPILGKGAPKPSRSRLESHRGEPHAKTLVFYGSEHGSKMGVLFIGAKCVPEPSCIRLESHRGRPLVQLGFVCVEKPQVNMKH